MCLNRGKKVIEN